MRRIVICAGGPVEELPDLHMYSQDETIFIGVDRGAVHLMAIGIIPSIAVGDFDSVTELEFEKIKGAIEEVSTFNANKDETDTELAMVRAITFNPDEVVLTGVTGGRLDHFESVLHLLYRFQLENEGIRFLIRNELNEMAFYRSGVHRINKTDKLPYISLFAFASVVKGLTLTGFKYETVNAIIEVGMTKFTSNELIAEVCTISFRQGICLMVRSSDS